MKIEIDTVKGFQDYLPPLSLKRNAVQKIIERWFQSYGFAPIETPVVEFDELMRSDTLGQEDEAVSERFRLKDRAGRNLGLRYEFTFQLARILKQNPNIKLPFKRYQIGQVFRDEPTGTGRFRQFTQCDIDIVGDVGIKGDAEILAAVMDILKALKIPAEIRVNNRRLLQALIESVEVKDIRAVMRELDKIGKIGEDLVKMNLKKYADSNQIITLFKLLEKDISFFIDNAFDGASDLDALKKECSLYGLEVKISPTMIRGLSYYTGNIFEVVASNGLSIAGGGRYDKVVGKYLDREIPATGISFGLERITELANIKLPSLPTALILSIGQNGASVKLAQKIRKEGISCILSFDKVGKALEYANSYSVPFVVFIGENEIKNKKFKVRDMKSGEEKELTDKALIKMLNE
ncbi:histidine--tRNA ligase [Candidatus Pacearchaeota archaeon]|nr:histidine--tRNA ligase [Candidatus Pacearchaeota archaeon]